MQLSSDMWNSDSYIHRAQQHIFVVNKSDNGLIWIKTDKRILLSDQDVSLCYVYVRDRNSKVAQQEENDYFEILQSDISKYKTLGKIFVTGDL